MKVTPLGDRILVKMVEMETKTAGGILIPQTAQEKTQEGVVIAVGDDEAIKVKAKDRVIYDKYAGTTIKVGGRRAAHPEGGRRPGKGRVRAHRSATQGRRRNRLLLFFLPEERRHRAQDLGGGRDRRAACAGRLSRNTAPYCFVTMRGSRMRTTPVSSWRRISLPNPWRIRTTASGRDSSPNGLPPRASIAAMRAFSTGSEGTRNGSRQRMTTCRVSPGASTPSQNESVAKSTLERSARKASRSRARSSSPCFMSRIPARAQLRLRPPRTSPAGGCTR